MANRACLRLRRNPNASTPCQAGFTLAELLIVIAIIGVLIAILLPALSAARRSANSVKCLASLKDLGQAFQLYAQENRRFYPVARWRPPSNAINATDPSTASPKERVWIDFIAKYIHKRDFNNDPANYKAVQGSSVFWGCPAYNQDFFDPIAAGANGDKKYSLSYGMNIYPLGPYSNIVPTGTLPSMQGGVATVTNRANTAIIDEQPQAPWTASQFGQFFKMEQWGRRGAEKALLMDSLGFFIDSSRAKYTYATEINTPANILFQPQFMGLTFPQAQPPAGGMWLMADASRHVSSTTDKKKVFKAKGINVLFVDGHAAPCTPHEAWVACFPGGTDWTTY